MIVGFLLFLFFHGSIRKRSKIPLFLVCPPADTPKSSLQNDTHLRELYTVVVRYKLNNSEQLPSPLVTFAPVPLCLGAAIILTLTHSRRGWGVPGAGHPTPLVAANYG